MSYAPRPALMIDPLKCLSCGGASDRRPNVDVCEMCGEKVHDISPPKLEQVCAIVHFMHCGGNAMVPHG